MPMRKLNMPQEKKAPRAQSLRVFRNPDYRTTRLLHAAPRGLLSGPTPS
jgi:hypothetical protein